MDIQFQMQEEYMEFFDPMNDWKPALRKTEIRYDPLTGDSSRILYYPVGTLQPPDYTDIAEKTKESGCPFCREYVFQQTPKFPSFLHPEGRFVFGDAVVFPNLFPYSKHSAVGIFSPDHYVTLDQFSVEMLTNGFMAAKKYLERVFACDPETGYGSINWNYMPMAGSSIIHPHLQIIASTRATNYQKNTMQQAKYYYDKHGQSYYRQLVEAEKTYQQRYIHAEQDLDWIHAFAPQGQMDFMAVYRDVSSFSQLTQENLASVSKGLVSIFKYLQSQGFVSFNLSLFAPVQSSPDYQVHVRIIPRTTLGFLGTSDANYFKVLHNESLSLKNPEDAVQEVKKYFA